MIPFLLAGLAVLLASVAPAHGPSEGLPARSARPPWWRRGRVDQGGILAALAAAPRDHPAAPRRGRPDRPPRARRPGGAREQRRPGPPVVRGHDVGSELRRIRRDHRSLVDIIAAHDGDRERVRVLAHPTPTAYCIPGRQSRVVLSQGVLDELPDDQLEAVIAHEDAHLAGRHDLLLEFFAVAHRAVPSRLRSAAALAEVRLLVEVLADRAAVRRSGEVATARALLALAGSREPEAALGVGTTAPVRLRLLADGPPHPALPVIAYTYAALAATLPVVLLAAAWA